MREFQVLKGKLRLLDKELVAKESLLYILKLLMCCTFDLYFTFQLQKWHIHF